MHTTVHWSGKAFLKLKSLKILVIRNAHFSRGPEHLPNSLRVLEWWGYPSPSLPLDFHPKKLLEFKDLSVMNFDLCKFITHIPDVSCLPNLREISLIGCVNLVEIHDSIGFLNNLKTFRASPCSKRTKLASVNLIGLEVLELHFNPSHHEASSSPKILGHMKESFLPVTNNMELSTSTQISVLPFMFAALPESNRLCIRLLCRESNENVSLVPWPKMKRLVMEWCDMSNESLSMLLMTWFPNLKTLNLRGSSGPSACWSMWADSRASEPLLVSNRSHDSFGKERVAGEARVELLVEVGELLSPVTEKVEVARGGELAVGTGASLLNISVALL
ncbi:disease resistance protein (TIR-NBS-LRR class) [Senna tora]|uniref:Disease resistance protein (TIR-NBS-LRR class) n=1 Tax=Senna tora TaxID=362788 RepID=A0A834T2F5_9FABA|nr:disease resistance protein (TIR-NBS-LRR class) [Senna tora]